MKLLICAGGTGGGVYPALTVLEALIQIVNPAGKPPREDLGSERRRTENGAEALSTLWVGSFGGMEEALVTRKAVPYKAIPAAGVHGVGWRALPGNVLRLVSGFNASRKILKESKPDILFFTGGYVAVPMAAANRSLIQKRTPMALFIPDIQPGLALQMLTKMADIIAVSTDESVKYLPDRANVYVTGYPTRPGLANWDKKSAAEHFNLNLDRQTICVLGGSTGARSINRALLAALPDLLSRMQIIHISGQRDWAEVSEARSRLTPELANDYHAFPYLHDEIGAAFRAADLVVSRAGASCLGEYPLFGLPAILVPYPHAWTYQQVNAAYLEKAQAAVILNDQDLSESLVPTIFELLSNPEKINKMRNAMLQLAKPDAAITLAQLLYQRASREWSPS